MPALRMRPAALGALAAFLAITSGAGDGDRADSGHDPATEFQAFDPRYRERKRACRDELERLNADHIAQQRAGRPTPCCRQVLAEAKCLVQQTADFDRARRRLRDLRSMLAAPADPHDGRQVPGDGSFGCCTEEWFLKLDNTVDELIALGLRLRRPQHPVTLLERINNPEKLRAYLDSVRVADVRATGIDTRTELNHSSSALTRLILWSDTIWEIPTKYRLDPGLKAALLESQDETWQDPETGYWGTWYRAVDGRVVKTVDLSITFHLVSFRGGEVRHWPEIVRTTLAIKDREYPYGWLEDGRMSNHHNDDVATLLHLGWPHMTPDQRDRVRVEVRRMLDWCLRETLEDDGSIRIMDESTLGGAFYFGVAVLDEVGDFRRANRFWTDEEFPRAGEVRDRIARRIRASKLTDPEARWALWMLEASP